MRIVFCDDDIEILNQLQRYVSEFFRGLGSTMPEFAFYESGDELLEHETSLDIAFLDVEMPGRSGIIVGAILKKINPQAKIFIVHTFYNMDINSVELTYNDGSVLTIDCEKVENHYDVTNGQMADLNWLLYNAAMEYANLVLSGEMENYLKGHALHGIEDS